MAAQRIEVNYDILNAVINNFNQQHTRLCDVEEILRSKLEMLPDGWQGRGSEAFFSEMHEEVMPRLRRLSDSMGEAARVTRQIIEEFKMAEDLAAGRFQNPSLGNYRVFVGMGNVRYTFGPDGKVNFIKLDEFPMHLIHGTRVDVWQSVMQGKMSYEDALKYLQEDPLAPKWHEYIDAKVKLYNVNMSAESALFDASLSGDLGTIRASMLGTREAHEFGINIDKDGLKLSGQQYYEAYLARLQGQTNIGGVDLKGELTGYGVEVYGKGDLSVGPNGLNAQTEIGGGYYVGKGQVSAQYAGWEATAQAEISAKAKLQAEAKFNPFSGDMYVGSEGELHAGGKISGQLTHDFGPIKIGVEGQLNYGVGGGYNANLGIKDGVVRADLGAFFSVGGGGGGRMIVEVDVEEAAQSAFEHGREGVEWLWDQIT